MIGAFRLHCISYVQSVFFVSLERRITVKKVGLSIRAQAILPARAQNSCTTAFRCSCSLSNQGCSQRLGFRDTAHERVPRHVVSSALSENCWFVRHLEASPELPKRVAGRAVDLRGSCRGDGARDITSRCLFHNRTVYVVFVL